MTRLEKEIEDIKTNLELEGDDKKRHFIQKELSKKEYKHRQNVFNINQANKKSILLNRQRLSTCMLSNSI